MVDRFLQLSEALTGESPLNRQLATEYLPRVLAMPQGVHLNALLNEFDAIVAAGGDTEVGIAARLLNNDELRGLVKVIILMWYFGEVRGRRRTDGSEEPSSDGHPEHYFQGLFWSIVAAHVPGLSGGYFGHWTYPPDN